jgi:glutamate 5-kinase
MPRKDYLKNIRRIVIKAGTSSLTDNGVISQAKIRRLADDAAALLKRGYQIVIVSSGAISAGAGALGKDRRNLTIPERQALASVGQAILINEYRLCFKENGYAVGQILLTEDDVKNRRRFLNGRYTIEALLDMGIVPVVNENDTVAVDEIKFGDNDTLSAHVACLIEAQLLIILSDVDGFFWDMRDSKPLETIEKITPDILERAHGAGSIGGTGGMITKLRAAELMLGFGEQMIIAKSSAENVLNRIMDGESIGTIFRGGGKRLSGKKKWVSLNKPKGALVLDAGAVNAICNGKKSLLASGILQAAGEFDMGETVDLRDESGSLVGRGIVNYKSRELEYIIGKNTKEIKKILGGSAFYDEAVNRDNLILF